MERVIGWNTLSMPTALPRATALVLVLVVVMTGCADVTSTVQNNPKATVGGVGGAAVGGLIAAAAGGGGAAIAASVIGGALIGGLAGNYLDQRDKQMAAQSAQRALESAPSGQAVAWNNPDSGHSGTVTPTRTYQSGSTYCREYQQSVTIDGKPERSYGTACRQPDGSWQIQN